MTNDRHIRQSEAERLDEQAEVEGGMTLAALAAVGLALFLVGVIVWVASRAVL